MEAIKDFLGVDSGSDSGSGSGDGYGLASINGKKIYKIDSVPTIIASIKGNIAKGFILASDLTLSPCFVVKEGNKFAHGVTLHESFNSLQEKLYENSSEEERLSKFKEHFPDFGKKYSAKELFIWHHVLTGSCAEGRKAFARSHNIEIEADSFTIYEFIELAKNSYNGGVIKKLLN